MLDEAIKILENYELKDSPYFKVSDGWKRVFQKRKDVSLKNINSFLLPSEKVAFGIGITSNDEAQELDSFNHLKRITNRKNSNIDETISLVGSEGLFGEEPINYDDFTRLTRSNLMNAGSYHEFRRSILPRLAKKKVRILEIGSGYGELARQIIKYSGFSSVHYDLIDLPDNLFFAELYLIAVFGQDAVLKNKFFQTGSPDTENMGVALSFYDPSEVSTLADNYDVIINSYSLQEMDKSVVTKYMAMISKKLGDNGLFFSINSPKKWNIHSYEDYNLSQFKNIESRMHRQVPPAGLSATVPIVNVFKNRSISDKCFSEESLQRTKLIGELQIIGFSAFLENLGEEEHLSITDPCESQCSLLDEIIALRDNRLTSAEVSLSANVLLSCIQEKPVSNSAMEHFLKQSTVNPYLSDLSVLLLSKLNNSETLNMLKKEVQLYYGE